MFVEIGYNMSKVALLLSGRLGEYEDCISNITSNIIEPLNADLYMYVSQGGKKDGIKEDMEPLKSLPLRLGFPPPLTICIENFKPVLI